VFNIIIRVLIIYVVVIGIMRLMGKRQIGEMEPFELVITLIIADLATIPMAEQSIPIWYGIIPLLVICVIHFSASLLTKKSPFMRDILNGKPAIVIDSNGIVFKELKKLNISCEELMEALRNLDYFDLSEVNYAIIERNGKITVIPKSANMPVTREDMKIKTPENEIFNCIIENGRAKREYQSILPHILPQIGGSLRTIAFASMTSEGDIYLQRHGQPAKSLTVKLPEEQGGAA